MSYQDYVILVDQTFHTFNWRYGQTIMNVLYSVSPNKYTELVGGEYDCYYEDSKALNTLKFLNEHWTNNESSR
jgi:hypothetical protein